LIKKGRKRSKKKEVAGGGGGDYDKINVLRLLRKKNESKSSDSGKGGNALTRGDDGFRT